MLITAVPCLIWFSLMWFLITWCLTLVSKNTYNMILVSTLRLIFRDMTDPLFLDLRSDPDPFVKSGSTIRSDPFTLLKKGSTIRSFQILFDPFRSNPCGLYLREGFPKSCIFWFSQDARLRALFLTRLQDLTKLWFY